MSYLKKYQWELNPINLPIIRRNCPKCNEKSSYINTERFRVNANKSNIDVWLIYQCEKCKSTWNMTIYERIKPYDINKDEYEKFLSNDKELAREYAFDLSIYSKNKAEVILEDVNYELIQKELKAYYTCETPTSKIIEARDSRKKQVFGSLLIASANVIVIRPNDKILGEYIKIFFESPIGMAIIKSFQRGTTIMNINYSDIMEMEIPLLSMDEQKKMIENYNEELSIYKDATRKAENRWNNIKNNIYNKLT